MPMPSVAVSRAFWPPGFTMRSRPSLLGKLKTTFGRDWRCFSLNAFSGPKRTPILRCDSPRLHAGARLQLRGLISSPQLIRPRSEAPRLPDCQAGAPAGSISSPKKHPPNSASEAPFFLSTVVSFLILIFYTMGFCRRVGFGDDIETAEAKRGRRLGLRRDSKWSVRVGLVSSVFLIFL